MRSRVWPASALWFIRSDRLLYERPLARLRGDLQRIGVEREEGLSEPEDHAAILCEVMAGLAGGSIGAPAGADREIFEKHLAPGSGASFPISSGLKRPTSTAASARSAVPSWK